MENATAKEYYACDVQINDQKICNVGLRTKGNTSLSSIAGNPETDRYSLKLEFDHYVEGQTCLGLDKLILNNNYADATSMKEAVVYDMYRYLGADASLYNYDEISVNGEYLGVYLALEAVEESFLMRNYGTGDGKLYKPDSMQMGGKGFEGEPPRHADFPDGKLPDFEDGMPPGGGDFELVDGEGRKPPDMEKKGSGAGPSMGGGNGADLNYTDVDNILKYMAVHAFSVNLDSLSGNMAHNYYLYEYNGMLNILPWDYNLAFGGMNQGPENGASDAINDAVDTPFAGTEFFDTLLEDEAYLSRYHGYLRQLAQEYVLDGRFQQVYQGIRRRIDTLVAADPTALYSYEEYEAGAEMLYQTVMLRAESVKGQIDGAIPATDEEQRADPSMLVDVSEIDISAMGVMDMGGGERKSARAAERR